MTLRLANQHTARSGFKVELEAPSGFEPEMEVLQTSALPLGYGALSGKTENHG